MPSESQYTPYMPNDNVQFYDHSITSRLSQLNIDSASNLNPQQQKTNYNELNSSMVHSTKPTITRNEATMISSHNDNSNSSFFVSESMREELVQRLAESQEIVNDNSSIELPSKVDVFIELVQIEPLSGASSFTFNMLSTVYKATNSETGQVFCLRRFHAFQPNTANAKLLMGTIDSWKRIHHANIIPLRQVFTTKAFGDNSVIFVYDYNPFSKTIMSCYFSNQVISTHTSHSSIMNGYSTLSRPFSQQQNTRKFLPEQIIWNYIIQISSALRTIHQANLAFRSLDPTKILITSGWNENTNSNNRGRDARVKLSCCGAFDILTLDTFHTSNHRAYIQHLQQEDLVRFGQLCLAIATNNLSAFTQQDNIQEYLDLLPRTYSNDLRNLISYFISYKSNQNKPRSIDDIMPMIGARFYMQLDYFYLRYDYLYNELTKEVDNGRLLRLLSKLGTINERPEHQLDPNWSETGDRYMLKLFRDYLFHQCDENGKPWLDLGHIISNLNKFDIGSPEKICLISRDAQNVIIVSFEELKRCFESAIKDLMQ